MPTSVKALKGRDLPTEKEASLYSDLLGGRGCLQLGDPGEIRHLQEDWPSPHQKVFGGCSVFVPKVTPPLARVFE